MFLLKRNKTHRLLSVLIQTKDELDRTEKKVAALTNKASQIRLGIDTNYKLYNKTHRGERKKLLAQEKNALLEYKTATIEAAAAKKRYFAAHKNVCDYAQSIIDIHEKYFDGAAVNARICKNRKWINITIIHPQFEYPNCYGDYDIHIASEKVKCNHKYVKVDPQQKYTTCKYAHI